MKQIVKKLQITKSALIFSVCLSLALFGIFSVNEAAAQVSQLRNAEGANANLLGKRAAKASPLSLADVLTGLRSKKTSLAQRNKLLASAVKERGITFKLTPEIEKEIKTAGANSVLLEAIRQKSPKPPTPVPAANPSGVMNAFNVEHNVFIGGKKGMLIRPDFTVYNLKNIDSQFVILFETNTGRSLKAVSSDYAGTTGSLIVGDFLTPCCEVSSYKDLRSFLPYAELNLGTGNHELRMNINLIYNNGTIITRFDYYYFTFRVG